MSNAADGDNEGPALGPLDETPTFVQPPTHPGETLTHPAGAAKEEAAPAQVPGGLLAGRYTVLGTLGKGGMGVVLAVYDARLDRRVALKLLRYPEAWGGGSGGEARLVHEAQAMARLSHPHVVAVYDAGTLEDGAVYIAMEYVEGTTLRRWQEQRPRAWREVLEAYLAAGRGLAAAHAVGLIHRDFKAENVLVGQDGRVRVTDFGLARVRASAPATGPLPAVPTVGMAGIVLTQPGTLMGTPRYMAPELLQGTPADVRSDLFAFCVALYEALYGQPPFAGDTLAELLRAQKEGRVSPPPAGHEVPAWVEGAVRRGLRADPGQRPASMQELLTALGDDPEVRRRAWRLRAMMGLMGAGLVGLASASGVLFQRLRSESEVCNRMETRLAEVWDEPVRAKVRESLLSTGLPYARDTAERVSTILDGYAGAWVKQRTEVCQAARQEGTVRPRSLTALREYCLERRRSELDALTDLLGRDPDEALVKKAVEAVRGLPSLAYCEDAKALMAVVPPPEDPALRARTEPLQQELDKLQALILAGKQKEGLLRANELLRQVEDTGHTPLHARALFLMASFRRYSNDFQGAEAALRQSIDKAALAQDVVLVSRGWMTLAMILTAQGRHQEALGLESNVMTTAALSGDARIQSQALTRLGYAGVSAGRYAEARKKFERAQLLAQQSTEPDYNNLSLASSGLAACLIHLGEYEEAIKQLERVIARMEHELGPEHPLLASPLMTLGSGFRLMGRYEEAERTHQRTLAHLEKVLGPEYHETLLLHVLLGHLLGEQERDEEAKQKLEYALPRLEKVLGPRHYNVLFAYSSLGQVLGRLGKWDEAQRHIDYALTTYEKDLGPEHPGIITPLTVQGELLRGQGKPAKAISFLERALRLAPEGSRAEIQWTLAQALWDTGKDRPRALELATQARDFWQRVGHAPRLAKVSPWLSDRANPSASR